MQTARGTTGRPFGRRWATPTRFAQRRHVDLLRVSSAICQAHTGPTSA